MSSKINNVLNDFDKIMKNAYLTNGNTALKLKMRLDIHKILENKTYSIIRLLFSKCIPAKILIKKTIWQN